MLAFAPTCHGKLPHPPEVRARRAKELVKLAERLRAQGTIFVYEGDSYYDVAEWDGFATRTAGRAPWLRIVRVSRPRVLELCDFCGRDSHGAYWDGRFAAAFFDDHVQTLIDGIRANSPNSLWLEMQCDVGSTRAVECGIDEHVEASG